MAAETIRDIVIRIRMQQDDAKLKPPDTSEFQQAIDSARRQAADLGAGANAGAGGSPATNTPQGRAQAAETALDKQASAAEKAYERETKAAITAYSRIMRERNQLAKEQERIAAQTAKYAETIDPTRGIVLNNPAAEMTRSLREYEGAAAQVQTVQRAQIEAFQGIGEGALRAVSHF